jgi:hypothetical protein
MLIGEDYYPVIVRIKTKHAPTFLWSTDCSYNFEKELKRFSFLGAKENPLATNVTGKQKF